MFKEITTFLNFREIGLSGTIRSSDPF